VLAIGNALGAYQNTVTQGVISGTGRSLEAGDSNGQNTETLTDMLQTDAAINPGNSGGPLVNAAGDVIGINTAVSTSANGLGFAIPISATKGMLNRIIAGKSAERAVLNLSYTTVTASLAKKNDLPVSKGAYVSKVIAGGPADEAGIEKGDIITKVGNVEVGRAGSISTLVGEYQVGDKVELTYRRGDDTKTAVVTLVGYEE
jgi:S1-C subfamily serine protease